jgi:hypothetical protein
MEVMDDCTATEIEEIFPLAAITSTAPLPMTEMSKGMFHSDAFAQLGPSC